MQELQTTSVPTNLTFDEVMKNAKPGQKLNKDQFLILANAAMNETAQKTEGQNGSRVRFIEFNTTLADFCTQFGDPIEERFVMVAHPNSPGHTRGSLGHRLLFNPGYGGSPDGYRYVAAVY